MRIESRAVRAGELDHELLWLLVGLTTAFAGAVLLGVIGAPRVICPLKAITGLPCVTCGSTRAALALMAGDLRLALRWNPAVVVGATVLSGYLVYAATTLLGLVPRLRVVVAADELSWVKRSVALATAALWLFLVLDGR
jgi:hypothetical protein